MKNTGLVYADGKGSICFTIGDFHIEFPASAILTEINEVTGHDNQGYIVIDTNYGDEFFSFSEALKDMGILDQYDIKSIMDSVDHWEVNNDALAGFVRPADNVIMVRSNISFEYAMMNDERVLKATDLTNRKCVANFYWDGDEFKQLTSTFPDGQRKEELHNIILWHTESLVYYDVRECEIDGIIETAYMLLYDCMKKWKVGFSEMADLIEKYGLARFIENNIDLLSEFGNQGSVIEIEQHILRTGGTLVTGDKQHKYMDSYAYFDSWKLVSSMIAHCMKVRSFGINEAFVKVFKTDLVLRVCDQKYFDKMRADLNCLLDLELDIELN